MRYEKIEDDDSLLRTVSPEGIERFTTPDDLRARLLLHRGKADEYEGSDDPAIQIQFRRHRDAAHEVGVALAACEELGVLDAAALDARRKKIAAEQLAARGAEEARAEAQYQAECRARAEKK